MTPPPLSDASSAARASYELLWRAMASPDSLAAQSAIRGDTPPYKPCRWEVSLPPRGGYILTVHRDDGVAHGVHVPCELPPVAAPFDVWRAVSCAEAEAADRLLGDLRATAAARWADTRTHEGALPPPPAGTPPAGVSSPPAWAQTYTGGVACLRGDRDVPCHGCASCHRPPSGGVPGCSRCGSDSGGRPLCVRCAMRAEHAEAVRRWHAAREYVTTNAPGDPRPGDPVPDLGVTRCSRCDTDGTPVGGCPTCRRVPFARVCPPWGKRECAGCSICHAARGEPRRQTATPELPLPPGMTFVGEGL